MSEMKQQIKRESASENRYMQRENAKKENQSGHRVFFAFGEYIALGEIG